MGFNVSKIWNGIKDYCSNKVKEGVKGVKELGNDIMNTRNSSISTKIAESLKDGKINENELVEIVKGPAETVKKTGQFAAKNLEKLGQNSLSGRISKWISGHSGKNLEKLGQNSLSGRISKWISGLFGKK